MKDKGEQEKIKRVQARLSSPTILRHVDALLLCIGFPTYRYGSLEVGCTWKTMCTAKPVRVGKSTVNASDE